MSTQRNIQKYRLVSSAPTTAANSPSHKHVHFREIQSHEPRRRCEYQTSWKRSSLQCHGIVLREDRNHSLLPSYTPTLSSAGGSSYNSIFNTPHRRNLEQSQQSFYRLPEDLLARGDFIAYQSGNAFDFFNSPNHARPQRISEICLVNDHFMLVKIPQNHWDHSSNTNMEAIAEEKESSRGDGGCEKGRREFFRCFPCQRSRRVLPESATADDGLSIEEPTGRIRSIFKSPLAHCWRVNEKPEVFNSHTKFFGNVFWKQKMPGKVITIQPSKGDTAAPLDLRIKTECNAILTADLENDNNNQHQIKAEVFGSPLHAPTTKVKAPPPPPPPIGDALKTSVHDTVSLEQHTAWINDDERINDLRQLKLATEKASPSPLVDSKTKKPKRSGSILHWFLKRRSKVSKAKSKIHAVVYKTYFVRWKKPPDMMCPHCGRSRTEEGEAVCKWRRCRSATF